MLAIYGQNWKGYVECKKRNLITNTVKERNGISCVDNYLSLSYSNLPQIPHEDVTTPFKKKNLKLLINLQPGTPGVRSPLFLLIRGSAIFQSSN